MFPATAESERLVTGVTAKNADVIAAVGSGKAVGTARDVLPLVVMPTIASAKAPTNACTVLKTDEKRKARRA